MQYILTQEELDEIKVPATEDCGEAKTIAKAVFNCKDVRIMYNQDFQEQSGLIHVVLRAKDLPGQLVHHLERMSKGMN